jgi:hypothetical protein
MRNGILLSALVGVMAWSGIARADIFEVPLPVTGTYHYLQTRDFSFDLGVRLQEVHAVRFRAEGSILSPLTGPAGGPYRPIDGAFIAALQREDMPTTAGAPSAGKDTYPDPEPFSGFGTFTEQTWGFLLDGTAEGRVYWGAAEFTTGGASGGQGILNSAMLIIDATPVPEPTALSILSILMLPLFRRQRLSPASA